MYFLLIIFTFLNTTGSKIIKRGRHCGFWQTNDDIHNYLFKWIVLLSPRVLLNCWWKSVLAGGVIVFDNDHELSSGAVWPHAAQTAC